MQTTYNSPLRVALFPDTFDEANGVATFSRQLALFARHRQIPFLVVRGGSHTGLTCDGSLETLTLKRGPASFPLDKGLHCDPFLMRHKEFVIESLQAFKPDLVHITGPGDIGFLGLWVAHILGIPLAASWHTNLHEYLARRLDRGLHLLPSVWRQRALGMVERQSLRALLRFYRTARFTLAPNQTFVDLLRAGTRNRSFLMPHGVDLAGYFPAHESYDSAGPFCVGYVGRLTAEKSVRDLVDVERTLINAGELNYKFLIVGEGGQGAWLARHLQRAEFLGVLHGEELAAAYQRMDAFVFPSRTDTFGLVMLEALASGVPVITTPESGRRVGIENGVSGFVSDNFAAGLLRLMHDCALQMAMSQAARRLACGHSWNAVFDGLYRIYSDGLTLAAKEREKEAALPLTT